MVKQELDSTQLRYDGFINGADEHDVLAGRTVPLLPLLIPMAAIVTFGLAYNGYQSVHAWLANKKAAKATTSYNISDAMKSFDAAKTANFHTAANQMGKRL